MLNPRRDEDVIKSQTLTGAINTDSVTTARATPGNVRPHTRCHRAQKNKNGLKTTAVERAFVFREPATSGTGAGVIDQRQQLPLTLPLSARPPAASIEVVFVATAVRVCEVRGCQDRGEKEGEGGVFQTP